MEHSDIELMAHGYPPAHIGKDCEEVIVWLATQLLAAQKQRDALAAENATIKTMNDVLSEELRGYESDGAYDDPIAHKLWHSNSDTPATDAYLNSVRAEAIPEGYVLVPERMHISADAMESLCFHCGDGGFLSGDFTDGILWVGDIENDDGTKTYGLNIATAEYPEEGSANVSEFAAQLRAGEPS